MIADKIAEYLGKNEPILNESIRYEVEKLAGYSFKRQFMTEEAPVSKGQIRLSASGRCPRQNAYAFHGFEKNGNELDGRARITFAMGDYSENLLVNLAKLAGVNLMAVGLQQDEILFNANGSIVKGHPDGYMWHEDEIWLVEFKSMSSFSFARFERGEIDQDI